MGKLRELFQIMCILFVKIKNIPLCVCARVCVYASLCHCIYRRALIISLLSRYLLPAECCTFLKQLFGHVLFSIWSVQQHPRLLLLFQSIYPGVLGLGFTTCLISYTLLLHSIYMFLSAFDISTFCVMLFRCGDGWNVLRSLLRHRFFFFHSIEAFIVSLFISQMMYNPS